MLDQRIYNIAYADLVGFANRAALAKEIVKQARHETGNYTSKHFRESKNLFGYSYYPKSRYQIGAGSVADNKQKVAKYATYEDSVHEVTSWIKRRKAKFEGVYDSKSYAVALKSAGYYQDTIKNYTGGLQAAARFLKDLDVSGAAAGGFALFAIIVILAIKFIL